MELLWQHACLGEMSTHDTDANEDADEDTRWTIHDYIGSGIYAKWAKII